MDLRKFIAETLTQIIGGISDAQGNMLEFQKGENSDYTAPYVNPNPTLENHKKFSDIEFDVAVTVSEGKSCEGGGGLSVAGLSIGGKGAQIKQTLQLAESSFQYLLVTRMFSRKNKSLTKSL